MPPQPGNTLYELRGNPLYFRGDINFPISLALPYGSLVYFGGFANYFETKLSLEGGICDHTLDVASEHLHVTYFIAAIQINSSSFRMWWSNEFRPVHNKITADRHALEKRPGWTHLLPGDVRLPFSANCGARSITRLFFLKKKAANVRCLEQWQLWSVLFC